MGRFGSASTSGPQHFRYDEYVHLWKTVEAMGYDWASVFDHFPHLLRSARSLLRGPTLLAAMAAHTSRIRCGIS
ncbi:MAG: LLM class flavin-dependent oxidoreductase [Dehalococcoidia bacterium]